MGWYVTHRMGGEMDRSVLVQLFKTASRLGMLLEANDVHTTTILKEDRLDGDMTDLLSHDGALAFYDPQHYEGSFPTLEAACMQAGVPFVSVVDVDEEAGGTSRWWKPGMDNIGSCLSDHDGETVITLKAVKEALADGSIERLVDESTIPVLTPVTIRD
jgi:hypothetical protein